MFPLSVAAGALLLDRISAAALAVLATGACAIAGAAALSSPALRNAR